MLPFTKCSEMSLETSDRFIVDKLWAILSQHLDLFLCSHNADRNDTIFLAEIHDHKTKCTASSCENDILVVTVLFG